MGTAGLTAALFHVLASAGSTMPMVGASGAIAGVMGAFLVRYWSSKIRFFYFVLLFRGTFAAPAWLMLPLWFVQQLAFGLAASEMGVRSGVAYWAHVGGFLFGAGAAFGVRHWQVEERYVHPAIESKVTIAEGNAAIEEAMQAREAGDIDAAYALLAEAWLTDANDADLALVYWDAAVSTQQPETAVDAMALVIRDALKRGDPAEAARSWSELCLPEIRN